MPPSLQIAGLQVPLLHLFSFSATDTVSLASLASVKTHSTAPQTLLLPWLCFSSTSCNFCLQLHFVKSKAGHRDTSISSSSKARSGGGCSVCPSGSFSSKLMSKERKKAEEAYFVDKRKKCRTENGERNDKPRAIWYVCSFLKEGRRVGASGRGRWRQHKSSSPPQKGDL